MIFQTLYGFNAGAMWFGQGPTHDYSYDGDVVYHEFTHAVVIDTRGDFDPWALLPFDPELSSLTVVRLDPEPSGEAATVLARAGAGFILLMGEVPEPWLGPLKEALS